MNPSREDKGLIERYLNGELTGIDLENFNTRLKNDKVFKDTTDFQHLLQQGILFSKETELKSKIVEKLKFRKTKVPFGLKLIITFLFVTTLGITLWFYVGTESASHTRSYLFSAFSFAGKEKEPDKKTVAPKNVEQHTSRAEVEEKSELSDSIQSKNESEVHQDANQIPSSDTTLAQGKTDDDNNIVVKKEKLLISAVVPVIEKPQPEAKQPDVTLSQEAAQKLNPAAGIPEEEKNAPNYQVEFWISPINYRGYKMSKSKLIIYGIEEPDAMKLYRLNDALFMKYGNEFFRLVNTFDYIPYQRLKESDVPLAIRQ